MSPLLESIILLSLVIFGFLVMFGVVPLRKIPGFILMIILIGLLGPVLIAIATNKISSFFAMRHAWWVYVLLFVGILIALRLFLDFLLPWRRRR